MERTKEQWKEIIEAQRQSGMSAAEYCRRHGIKEKRFLYHRSRFSSESQYTVLKPVKDERIEIELKNDTKLRVTTSQLKEVLDVLRS